MIMVNAHHTIQLVEKCLAMKEDRILRCGNNEPWGYSIMCAATGLLEAHLGEKTSEAAKASSAERFINLHYKLLAWQDPPASSAGQQPTAKQVPYEVPLDRPKVSSAQLSIGRSERVDSQSRLLTTRFYGVVCYPLSPRLTGVQPRSYHDGCSADTLVAPRRRYHGMFVDAVTLLDCPGDGLDRLVYLLTSFFRSSQHRRLTLISA